jgi:hypothetical protein
VQGRRKTDANYRIIMKIKLFVQLKSLGREAIYQNGKGGDIRRVNSTKRKAQIFCKILNLFRKKSKK